MGITALSQNYPRWPRERWERERVEVATRLSGSGPNDGEDKATKWRPRSGGGNDGDGSAMKETSFGNEDRAWTLDPMVETQEVIEFGRR